MEVLRCIRCGGVMELGRVRVGQLFWKLEWLPKPARAFVRTLKFTKVYAVVTYRCVDCGTLESVAPTAE